MTSEDDIVSYGATARITCHHSKRMLDVGKDWVPQRNVAEFAKRSAGRDAPPCPPGPWELLNQGHERSAKRGKRGTWELHCVRCQRNVRTPERRLFQALDELFAKPRLSDSPFDKLRRDVDLLALQDACS